MQNVPVGKLNFEMILKSRGMLGLFLNRILECRIPVQCILQQSCLPPYEHDHGFQQSKPLNNSSDTAVILSAIYFCPFQYVLAY